MFRAMSDAAQPMTEPTAMIDPVEAESFAVVPGRADCGLIFLCDHAGNAFPPDKEKACNYQGAAKAIQQCVEVREYS